MPAAPLPDDEVARLDDLRALDILDTVPEQSFDDLTRLAAELIDTPIALVSLIDKDRQWFKANVGLDAQETSRDAAFCSYAILKPGETMVVEDAEADPRFADNPLVTGAPDIRFYAGTPLVTSRGHALGTLCVIDRVPREITPAQREALEALGRQTVALFELRRSVTQLKAAARVREQHEKELEATQTRLRASLVELAERNMRDPLTGLYNRTSLADRLAAELGAHRRSERPVAVMMIDIDHFKKRNDDFGHAAGDEVLRELAKVLLDAVRDEDTAARYGGEEFTIVLSDTSRGGALLAAERLRRAVAAIPFDEGPITVSIGVAAAEPGRDLPDDLLDAADKALYAAKQSGRNRVVVAPLVGATPADDPQVIVDQTRSVPATKVV